MIAGAGSSRQDQSAGGAFWLETKGKRKNGSTQRGTPVGGGGELRYFRLGYLDFLGKWEAELIADVEEDDVLRVVLREVVKGSEKNNENNSRSSY